MTQYVVVIGVYFSSIISDNMPKVCVFFAHHNKTKEFIMNKLQKAKFNISKHLDNKYSKELIHAGVMVNKDIAKIFAKSNIFSSFSSGNIDSNLTDSEMFSIIKNKTMIIDDNYDAPFSFDPSKMEHRKLNKADKNNHVEFIESALKYLKGEFNYNNALVIRNDLDYKNLSSKDLGVYPSDLMCTYIARYIFFMVKERLGVRTNCTGASSYMFVFDKARKVFNYFNAVINQVKANQHGWLGSMKSYSGGRIEDILLQGVKRPREEELNDVKNFVNDDLWELANWIKHHLTHPIDIELRKADLMEDPSLESDFEYIKSKQQGRVRVDWRVGIKTYQDYNSSGGEFDIANYLTLDLKYRG